jgi:uncharacterized protein (DUF58 family)
MIAEFQYTLNWRVHGAHPGAHPSAQAGGGFEFQGHVPFFAEPDPRKLDARATLADPLGRLMVKRFRQRASAPVYLLADLSASMGFQGQVLKTELLAEFAAAAAWSAWRSGDPFGFFACEAQIRWDLSLPLRWHKGMALELRERLRAFQPTAPHAKGLLEAIPHLGRHKALVFLVSDFHWPQPELEAVFDACAGHALVPVVLWDSAEYADLPAWGWLNWRDPETGGERLLFMRPSLRARIQERFQQRREALQSLCARYGREPFFLIDRFDPDAMTAYFFQSAAEAQR